MVATWSPLARNQRTQAAPMPRFPPVTRTTAISACVRDAQPDQRLTLLDPLAVDGQPTDDLAGEGCPHLGDPDPADQVADLDSSSWVAVGPPSVPGQQPGAGRPQRCLGGEDAAARTDHHPLGHVEVLALVQGGFGPPGPGGADLVHQRVEVGRLGHRERLDLGQAALGQPAQHAARARAPPVR